MQLNPLNPSFFNRNTVIVAQDLLGKCLVRTIGDQVVVGIITETEAYTGADDPASHSFKGKTPRTAALFGPVGHAYIYFIYGNHYCLNVVAREAAQSSGGVLIRAVEPLIGIEYMQANRGKKIARGQLTNGPGKVAQAFAIDKKLYGHCLYKKGELYLADYAASIEAIIASSRVGISSAQEKQYRFQVILKR